MAPSARRIFVPCAPLDLDSFGRIDWTLRTVLKEVKQNHGKYPHSVRAPTIREVLLRSGLSVKYLEFQGGSPYREVLKTRYKKKIKRVLRRIKSGRYLSVSNSQPSDSGRMEPHSWSKLRGQLQSLKQRWVEAELEYIDAENRIRELQAVVEELTEDNERLRNLLSDLGVHVLHNPSDR